VVALCFGAVLLPVRQLDADEILDHLKISNLRTSTRQLKSLTQTQLVENVSQANAKLLEPSENPLKKYILKTKQFCQHASKMDSNPCICVDW